MTQQNDITDVKGEGIALPTPKQGFRVEQKSSELKSNSSQEVP